MTISKTLAPALCALLFVGCGDDNSSDASYTPPLEYEFSFRSDTDSTSTVSNSKAITQTLLSNELNEFIASSNTIGAASSALSRINQIIDLGTVTPLEENDTSLRNSNIYTGEYGSPTPINLTADLPVLQGFFSELPVDTNLKDAVFSLFRKLPFTTESEVTVSGSTSTVEVGEFIGWPLIDEVENGNLMPTKLLEIWTQEVSVLMTDDDLTSTVINDKGLHFDELIKGLILGAVNYSSISQFNLVANKGLIKQNSLALNLSEVEGQQDKVEASEAALERIEESLLSLETQRKEQLKKWLAADNQANPEEHDLVFYNDIDQYIPIFLAEAYFKIIDKIEAKEDSKVESEKSLAELKEAVDDVLPYTDLANNWDEAFGYFGAARNYGLRSDAEILSNVYEDDISPDGFIDVFTEMNFGYALLASQRDAGAKLANTDFSGNIWNAFLMGRQIIQQNHGREAVEHVGYHADLKEQADIIVKNIEKVIAASIIHNINLTIGDLNSVLGEAEIVPAGVDLSQLDAINFSYYKNWSKLKGMAMTLQFNDSPTISKEDLIMVHELIGEQPRPGDSVVEEAADTDESSAEESTPISHNYAGRRFKLAAARDIIRDTYGFSEVNAEAW